MLSVRDYFLLEITIAAPASATPASARPAVAPVAAVLSEAAAEEVAVESSMKYEMLKGSDIMDGKVDI